MKLTRKQFKSLHQTARQKNLGTLACSTDRDTYAWFLREVFDLRLFSNPRLRTFDYLRSKLVKHGKHFARLNYNIGPSHNGK